MKLILVEWVDIMSWSGWNDDLVKDGKDIPETFYTVGFLLNKTKEKLSISDTAPEVGSVTTFPMGCVKSIKEIKYGVPQALRNKKAT